MQLFLQTIHNNSKSFHRHLQQAYHTYYTALWQLAQVLLHAQHTARDFSTQLVSLSTSHCPIFCRLRINFSVEPWFSTSKVNKVSEMILHEPGQTHLIPRPIILPQHQQAVLKCQRKISYQHYYTPALPYINTQLLTQCQPLPCPSRDRNLLGYNRMHYCRWGEYTHLTVLLFLAVWVSAFVAPWDTKGHRLTCCTENTHTVFVCQAAGKLFAMAACVVLKVGGTGGASQHSGAKQPGALWPWKGMEGVSMTSPHHATTEKQC